MRGAPGPTAGAGAKMRSQIASQASSPNMNYLHFGQPGASGSSGFSWTPTIAAPPPLACTSNPSGVAGSQTVPVSSSVGGLAMLARDTAQITPVRQASPPAVRRFVSPRQSAAQVHPAANLPFGKPTASWPSSAPTRQYSTGSLKGAATVVSPVQRHPSATRLSWTQGAGERTFETTPRSVRYSDPGSERQSEVTRQGSVPRQPDVPMRTSSLERHSSSALGSREGSPERPVTPERDVPSQDSTLQESQQVKVAGLAGNESQNHSRLGPAEQTGGLTSSESQNHLRLGPAEQSGGSRGTGGRGKPSAAGAPPPGSASAPCGPQSQRFVRPSKKEPIGSRARVCSPRSKRAARPSLGSGGRADKVDDEGNLSPRRVHSPREDRIGLAGVPRSGSQVELRAHVESAKSGDREEMSTMVALRRELEDMKHENSKLQDKLCKARNLVLLLQRQADEARAERDREHRRCEGLQLSAQQLQRQLRRETAKAQMLERTLSAASRSGETPPACSGSGSAREARNYHEAVDLQDPRLTSGVPDGDFYEPMSNGGVENSSHGPELQDLNIHETEQHVDAMPPENAATEVGFSQVGYSGAGGAPLEKSWEFVVQGQHDPIEQPDFAPKLVSCFPDDAVQRAWVRGVACICTRGRRLDSSVPNQDDFLIARHSLAHDGHIALYGVFDGHGPAGHHCAAFARGSLPENLFGQHTLLMKPEDTLRNAFQQTQAGLLQQPFDTENSGTTAALALVLNIPSAPVAGSTAEHGATLDGALQQESQMAPVPEASADQHIAAESLSEGRQCETWLFVAHVGDSRVILASRSDSEASYDLLPSARAVHPQLFPSFSVAPLTRDHRPDDNEEAARICQEGGEVRKLGRSSGAVRVYAAGEDRPALALTRSLGASASTCCGVSAEPEVSAYKLRPGTDVLLLLGTDGLFEFCNHMESVGKLLREGTSVQALEEICLESRRSWARSSYNETVDDITAIAVSLPINIG